MDLCVTYNNNCGLNSEREAYNNVIKYEKECYFSLVLEDSVLYTQR